MSIRLSKAERDKLLATPGAVVGPPPRLVGQSPPTVATRCTIGTIGALALTVSVACRVVSEANARCHWAARRRRFQAQAAAVDAALLPLRGLVEFAAGAVAAGGRAAVTLTRLGGQAMDDDNLRGAFKGVRDHLARNYLGVDDGDPRVAWEYGQQPGGPESVLLSIETGAST
jgi:hypothetical protein